MDKIAESFIAFVVEDADSIRQLLVKLLQKVGYTIHAFPDAVSAKESYPSLRPDLILLDWMLPGTSGIDFCRWVREQEPYQPYIIMATAKTATYDIESALTAGVDDYITKPFAMEYLSIRIRIATKRVRDNKQRQLLKKTAEEAILYRDKLMEMVPIGIVIINAEDLTIMDCNDEVLRMVGRSSEEVLGNRCHDFICPNDQDCCPVRDQKISLNGKECVLLSGAKKEIEKRIYKTTRLIPLPDGDVILECLTDIDELSKAQEKLQRYADEMEHLAMDRAKLLVHADRLAQVGTMAAGLAHEIGNALSAVGPNVQMAQKYWNAIHALLETMEAKDQCDPKQAYAIQNMREILNKTLEGARRSQHLLHNIKNFSKTSQGDTHPFLLSEAVNNAIGICQNLIKYGIEVKTDIPGDLMIKGWSKVSMEQILMNLISNACHALGKQGEIQIDAETREGDHYIRISDNGPGIPEEILDSIWEPFFTTKGDTIGTGLGLHIVRDIIKQHKGDITAGRSEALGGACFSLCLPVGHST